MTVVLQAMRFHPRDHHIHEQAAAALAIICELDQAKEAWTNLKVGEQGNEVSACTLLCRSIQTMYRYPAAAKQVLKLTALVALAPTVKVLIVQGAPPPLPHVLETMAHNQGDPAVMYYCLKALAALAHPQPPPESAQICVDIIDQVVISMKTHFKDVRVQETGCEVISKLALMEELQDAIRLKCVIGVVCMALKNFESDQGIQRKGCRALANIAEYEESRVEIRNQGGIKCVVQSMRYHVAHPEVGEQGCAAIANLALNEQNRVEVANSDGVKAVLAGLQRHQNHPGIQAYGLGALGNLAVHEENCRVILQAGAIQMVIHAMRTWPNEARVQHFACVACSNFAHDDANKVAIGKAGGNRLIIESMTRHIDHVGTQEQGCGALANLGIHANNMVEIASLNGIEVVIAALRRHHHHKGVQENASFALSKFLAMPNENYRQRMKSAGAEEALTKVRDGDPPPDFDVRICVNVLLRRLNEEAPAQAQFQQSHGKGGGQWGYGQQMGQQILRPQAGQAVHIQHVQPVPMMHQVSPHAMYGKGKGRVH